MDLIEFRHFAQHESTGTFWVTGFAVMRGADVQVTRFAGTSYNHFLFEVEKGSFKIGYTVHEDLDLQKITVYADCFARMVDAALVAGADARAATLPHEAAQEVAA
jgi:hypothetical protein